MANLSSFYPQPVVAGTTAGTYAAGNDPRFGDGLAEAPEDGIIYGRKDADWVDITAPANLQIRRGTAAEVNAITPLVGEPVWETDVKKLVIGDGVTLGGVLASRFPLDGSPMNPTGTNSTTPSAGKVFLASEVEAIGGTFLGGPFVTGNARGNGAVDFQGERTVATQVASGAYSFIVGSTRSTASGTRSAIIASSSSTASGSQSAVLCGGSGSSATGVASLSINGNATADNASAFHGIADRFGMFSHGSRGSISGFGTTERAQAVQFILKGRTTNATPTELMFNIVQPYLTIPQNVVLFGVVEICAIEETNATEAVHYLRKFSIQNLSGSTSLVGSVTTVGTDYESDSGLDVSITADDNSDYLKISVTGSASKTLRWVATVRGTEIEIS